jgi:hypothetical protein
MGSVEVDWCRPMPLAEDLLSSILQPDSRMPSVIARIDRAIADPFALPARLTIFHQCFR